MCFRRNVPLIVKNNTWDEMLGTSVLGRIYKKEN